MEGRTVADVVGNSWAMVGLVLVLLAMGSVIFKNRKGRWPWEKENK